LAGLLVDLHQQFDTLELGDSDFQRTVIDALASNESILATHQQYFKEWSGVLAAYNETTSAESSLTKRSRLQSIPLQRV
jgi:DNA repair protein RecN (Recombination protein N)